MTQRYSRASGLFFDAPMALLPSKMDEIRVFWESKLAGAAIDFEDRMEPFAVQFVPTMVEMCGNCHHAVESHSNEGHNSPMDDCNANCLIAGCDCENPVEITAAVQGASGGGGQIAVIPMHGVLAPRMNMMMAMSGGTSTSMFANALREQVNNPQVKAIIIDCDSPGGAVAGMQELADSMYELRGTKPIVAVVNHLGASAAYNAISQADEIVASPSAQLGHIGVATLLVDRSGELEQAGVKVRQVTAGKYKHEQAMGSDLVPMDDSKIQHAQQQVDEAYTSFVNNVARGRGVKANDVRGGFGEGRVVGAQEAVRLGMADRIATLDATIQRFASGGRVSRRGAAAGGYIGSNGETLVEIDADGNVIPGRGDPEIEAALMAVRSMKAAAMPAGGCCQDGCDCCTDTECNCGSECACPAAPSAKIEPTNPLAIETEQRERAYAYERVN